jgi:hypothetical protein
VVLGHHDSSGDFVARIIITAVVAWISFIRNDIHYSEKQKLYREQDSSDRLWSW